MTISLRRRIAHGLGANAFGQMVTICIQLVSLPLFLRYWDTATYGVWIMLSALPAYLTMADMGMTATAGNRMTMATGQENFKLANKIFHSTLVFMIVVCGGLAIVTLPIIWWIAIPGVTTIDQRIALLVLATSVFLSLFGGLNETLFRATGRYAQGIVLGNVVRLMEWVGWMTGLVLSGSFSGVAIGGLGMRLLGLLTTAILARPEKYGLSWGIRVASLVEVKQMAKPATSFMVFPLSNALSFQGVTLLVGYLLGPASVAVFNVYRTLARVAVQFTAMFSHSVWPEFSRLYGQGGVDAVRVLYRRSAWLGAAQAIGLSIALYIAAPWVLKIWTHDTIGFDPVLMLLLLAYAAVGGIWHVPRILLMATNAHIKLANWALLAAVLVLTLSAIAGVTMALPGVGLAMLVSESIIAFICIRIANNFITTQLFVKRENSI